MIYTASIRIILRSYYHFLDRLHKRLQKDVPCVAGMTVLKTCLSAPTGTITSGKKKGKVVPLRSTEAHLGDRRYSSYSFLTLALEGGEWSASWPACSLPPRKEPPVPIVQEAGWAPEPVWMQRLEEKSSASVGDRKPAVQSVVRHHTDCATRLIQSPQTHSNLLSIN
jgi:hypothetical protein